MKGSLITMMDIYDLWVSNNSMLTLISLGWKLFHFSDQLTLKLNVGLPTPSYKRHYEAVTMTQYFTGDGEMEK